MQTARERSRSITRIAQGHDLSMRSSMQLRSARPRLTREEKYNYIIVVTEGDDLRWIWTDEKNRINKRDHGLSFETAQDVFRDPLAASRRDPDPREER